MAEVIGVTLLVQFSVTIAVQQASASECRNIGGGCPCPAPEPRLEVPVGQSLFWQDPCGGGYRDELLPCYEHNSCPPTWFASGEFLPLFRDQSGSAPFQALATRRVQQENGEDVVTYLRDATLSTSDFKTKFRPGVRAMFGRALGDWYRVEFSYIGASPWSDWAAVRYQRIDENGENGIDDGNMLSPFSNFGDPNGPPGLGPVTEENFRPNENLDNNDYAEISFSSELHSAEANLRRRLCVGTGRYYQGEASCLIGLRYVKVEETFGYFTQSAIAENRVNISTDNDLIGPQLGGMAQFLVHDRAWIDAEIKGAILFTEAKSTTSADLAVGAGPRLIRGTADATAFLGDLSVTLNYQFTPSLTARAGYNAFWLNGVALASRNFNPSVDSLLNDARARVDHSGRVVYHGPSLGLVYAR